MATAKQLHSRFKRKEISKKILRGLLISGTICITASSPYAAWYLLKQLNQISISDFRRKLTPKEKKQMLNTFDYLKRSGKLIISYQNNQAYIKLSKEGKKLAKQYQIDELEIKQPKKWDSKWRIILFDIPEKTKLKRETLRGKLKELGFTMIQKSVWVTPCPCKDEVEFLKQFFGFKEEHYLFLETPNIGIYEKKLKTQYRLIINNT